jgi:hypothetical protein
MTPHSAHLSSLHFSYVIALFIPSMDLLFLLLDRAPFPLTLFYVLDISLVPDQTMQLMSAGQITDYDCRVLDSDVCYIQDRRTGHLVGIGPCQHNSEHLWELAWLRLPSVAPVSLVSFASAASFTLLFAQWHHRLGHICGS